MHSGACGPAFCSTMMSSGATSSFGSSIRAARSASEENTTARPSCSNSLASAAERLQRFVGLGDDRAVDVAVGVAFEALAECFAGHGHAVEMQQRLELAQQRAHAARRAKVFHIAVADRLEIDQHGG